MNHGDSGEAGQDLQYGTSKTQIDQLVCLFILLMIVGGGCNSKDDQRSKTEQQRSFADPRAVQFLFHAEYALNNGIYNTALVLADSAERYAPELADIHFLRGETYTELLRFDEAKTAYEKVLSLDPEYPGIYLNLGNTAFRKGELQQALNLYKKEKEASTRVAVMLQIGRAYGALGKADSARQAYEKVIALDSSYATAYMRLGQLYKDEGELEKALEYSKKGLRLDPDNTNYQYVVASILLLAGQPDAAATYLETLIKKRPWHYWANYNYGQALVRSGHEEKGQRYLAAAESLQAQIKLLDEWRIMVENNPDQQGIWINYGDVLARSGRLDEAIHAHNVALSLGPPYLALQSNLATLYMMNGDTAKAMGRFHRMLRQDSTYADAWLNLGVAYVNSGKRDEARQAWKKALKYEPGDSLTMKYLEKLSDLK